MKKLLVCLLTIIMLFALCSCGDVKIAKQQPTFKVECTDGITRELTIAKMYKMYEKDNAQALVTNDTIISGTGMVVSPAVRETAWNYYNHKPTSFDAKIKLDNGITISFTYSQCNTSSTLPDFDFSMNEKVAFRGKISYFPREDQLTITSTYDYYLDGDEGEDAYIPVWSVG